MNELTIWTYETTNVRTIEKDGETWWVLADVCKALEVSNSRNVAARLDEDEKDVHLIDTLGGMQDMTIINESGLYAVILRSDKPQAKPFRRWVTHEVLPEIRRHGSYNMQQTFSENKILDNIIAAESLLTISNHEAKELCAIAFAKQEKLFFMPSLRDFTVNDITFAVFKNKNNVSLFEIEIVFKAYAIPYILKKTRRGNSEKWEESLFRLSELRLQ